MLRVGQTLTPLQGLNPCHRCLIWREEVSKKEGQMVTQMTVMTEMTTVLRHRHSVRRVMTLLSLTLAVTSVIVCRTMTLKRRRQHSRQMTEKPGHVQT